MNHGKNNLDRPPTPEARNTSDIRALIRRDGFISPRTEARLLRVGASCTRCKIRMLPSIPSCGSYFHYCMACCVAVEVSGEVSTILHMVTPNKFRP